MERLVDSFHEMNLLDIKPRAIQKNEKIIRNICIENIRLKKENDALKYQLKQLQAHVQTHFMPTWVK